MKLAEALLLRKQLKEKVDQLRPIKEMGDGGLFEIKTKRVNISDQTDDITLQVPHVDLKDVTKEFDKYATAYRKLDAAIQRTNWAADLEGFTDGENPFDGK